MSVKALLLVSFLLIFILESITSIAYYHRNKSDIQSISSTAAAIKWAFLKIQTRNTSYKLDRLISSRNKGIDAFPWFPFDPALYRDEKYFYLANVPLTKIVYCEETEGIADWQSDEFGFRNPIGQVNNDVDLILLGDSFAEGACVSEAYTFAGILREDAKAVLNLARGGTGPLYSLAVLREYGQSVRTKSILWVIFTGNDLADLKAEKRTRLSNYLSNRYTQNLSKNRHEVATNLRNLLENEIAIQLRQKERISPIERTSIRTGNEYVNVENEVGLLLEILGKVKDISLSRGSSLSFAIVAHPRYGNYTVQDQTAETVMNFARHNNLPFIYFSRDYLSDNWESFYTSGSPHFNLIGYQSVGHKIRDWLSSGENVLVLKDGSLDQGIK